MTKKIMESVFCLVAGVIIGAAVAWVVYDVFGMFKIGALAIGSGTAWAMYDNLKPLREKNMIYYGKLKNLKERMKV